MRILDTRIMEWEPSGFPGGFRRVLTRDADGDPMWFISFIAGETAVSPALPRRHGHHRMREFSFGLAGQYPVWEYRDPDDQHGRLAMLRPGYFFCRAPGSIHGREPGPLTPTGWLSLTWRDRKGNWMYEPEWAQESMEYGYDDDWQQDPGYETMRPGPDGTVVESEALTMRDTVAMDWSQGEDGCLRKHLLSIPAVQIVHVPAITGGLPSSLEFAYVLDGSAAVPGGGHVREGAFIEWEGSVPGAARPGPAGLTMLQWDRP
jgi:hypothetical protein